MDKCNMDPGMMPECCAQWSQGGKCEGNGTCPYRAGDSGVNTETTLTVAGRNVCTVKGVLCDCTFWPCNTCPACIANNDCCPLESHLIYRSVSQDPDQMSHDELKRAYARLLLKVKRADAMLMEIWGAYNKIGDALKEKHE